MPWKVIFHDDFAREVLEMEASVRKELIGKIHLLEEFGPELKRPMPIR